MATATNQTTIIGGTLNGSYKSIDEVNLSIQKIINEFEGLVLIREKLLKTRTTGTIWYKGQVLCFTVEDVVRKKKVDDQTAIPDNIKDPSKTETLDSNSYNVTLDVTGNKNLYKNYVKFPNDKRAIFRSPGVFPRVGTDLSAGNLSFDGLSFGGIRIHAGSSENSSSGCIIVSKTRKADGTLVFDLETSHNITKFIYQTFGFNLGKSVSKMIVINEFEFPPPPPIVESTGVIVSQSTNEPIKGATITLPKAPTLGPTIIPQ